MLIFDSKKYSFNTYLSEHMYRDQDGYLVCESAIFGRTGIQRYGAKELGLKDKSGIIEVHRKAEDVFDEESLKSLEGRPFVLGHNDGTNVKNFFQKAKGIVFNVRREGNNIVGDIRIYDQKTADLVESGKLRELSLGYKSKLFFDEETGEYSFKNIIYNHLALVEKGRAGNAMIFDEERTEQEMENQELETKDEVVEETEEVKDEAEEKVENEEEVKDEEKAENKEEKAEEKEDKENTKEEKVEDEQPEEKEKKEMVKDTAYFLEMQERIAKIDDKETRQKLSQSLAKEMKESGLFEIKQEPTIVVDSAEDEEEETLSHEDVMNHYYSQFDPHLYNTEAEYEKARRELSNSKPTEKIILEQRVKK